MIDWKNIKLDLFSEEEFNENKTQLEKSSSIISEEINKINKIISKD